MPEEAVGIPFPVLGLSDDVAFGDQPTGTTREAQNVRLIDPRTGRARGAQRAGLSEFNTNIIEPTASKKIQDLNSIVFDSNNVLYANAVNGSEGTSWKAITPKKKDTVNVKSDRQSNAYVIDGEKAVVKYNATGTEIWAIAPPLADAAHTLRALHIDSFDCVYMGVSGGGSQDTARFWKYAQLPDEKVQQIWEIEPGGYIEAIEVVSDKMYVAVNYPDLFLGRIHVYQAIDSSSPVLVQVIHDVAHPISEMKLKADGSVMVSSLRPAEAPTGTKMRALSPLSRTTSPTKVVWTPKNLTNWEKRIWAWHDAEDVSGLGNKNGIKSDLLEEGDDVAFWADISGHGRHISTNITDSFTAPTYIERALAHKPGVNFGDGQGLISGVNASADAEMRDTQRTSLPMYTTGTADDTENAMWAAFIVCRPKRDTTVIGTIFEQNNGLGASEAVIAALVNRAAGTVVPGTGSTDLVSFYANVSGSPDQGASGVAGHPVAADWMTYGHTGNPFGATNKTGAFLLTIIHCGAVATGNPGTAFTRSIVRINGEPIDRWESDFIGSIDATRWGNTAHHASWGHLNGTIHEIIVLDRKDHGSNTEPTVLTHDKFGHQSSGAPNDTAWGDQSDDELTKIEGYLAHKWGLAFNLPGLASGGNTYAHPYGQGGTDSTTQDLVAGPPPNAESGGAGNSLAIYSCVTKYDPSGKLVFCANEVGNAGGGFGSGLAIHPDGNSFYTVGRKAEQISNNLAVRRIIDNGDTVSYLSGDGAWASNVTGGNDTFATTLLYPKIDVDEFGNLFVPIDEGIHSFNVFGPTGSILITHTIQPDALELGAQAIAVDTNIPEYDSDLTSDIAENIYVATRSADFQNPALPTEETIHKIQLVTVTAQTGSSRARTHIAVSDGDIVTFVSGSTTPTAVAGSPHFQSGSTASQYVQSTVLFQKWYAADGVGYQKFDPKTAVASSFDPTSSGRLPPRRKLIEAWRDRLVVARSASDPHIWDMSAFGDPDDWDFFPPVPNERQAISGTNTDGPGASPDIVNTLVPYTDDILLFGGDHSIWALVNDPAAGGRFDLVSDITGMSFGRPWAKDPNGVLYFFGSRGGLYRMVPGGRPERVSLRRIDRRLQDIDLSTHYIRLAYNYRDEGIHIFQCPFGTGGTTVKHWFYDIKHDGFWEDKFGTSANTTVQPSSVWVIDGDEAADRIMIMGCEDGKVRQWDESSKNDTVSLAVDSLVTMGPVEGQTPGYEIQFSGLTAVLGSQDDGCRYELFSAEEPSSIGEVLRSGTLEPGRNPPKWDRMTGAYCFMRLRNASIDQRWSYERAFMYAAPGGQARPRKVGS